MTPYGRHPRVRLGMMVRVHEETSRVSMNSPKYRKRGLLWISRHSDSTSEKGGNAASDVCRCSYSRSTSFSSSGRMSLIIVVPAVSFLLAQHLMHERYGDR